jgi:hypothetical protein
MYTVEYVEGGFNKIETRFETIEQAKSWADRNGLKLVKDPENDYEARIVKE